MPRGWLRKEDIRTAETTSAAAAATAKWRPASLWGRRFRLPTGSEKSLSTSSVAMPASSMHPTARIAVSFVAYINPANTPVLAAQIARLWRQYRNRHSTAQKLSKTMKQNAPKVELL